MNWPYLTDPKVAVAGEFKSSPEDFVVEEVPLYSPCGSGEHLYILIEKRLKTTDYVVRELANRLGIKIKAIGYAGKKDRVGLTRQWLSLHGVSPQEVRSLNIPGVTILETAFHRNKLRVGHLKGNRFTIWLNHVPPDAITVVRPLLAELEKKGVPNYFGPQRFGTRGDNHLAGLAAFRKDWKEFFDLVLGRPATGESPAITEARRLYMEGNYSLALEAWPREQNFPRTALQKIIQTKGDVTRAASLLSPGHLKIYLNALQSYWFNQCLARRLPSLGQLWQGDLAYLHRNGAVFRVESPEAEQPRADAFEISPSGPIFGQKMIEPEAKEQELEQAVLRESGMSPEELQQGFRTWRLTGQRRSYRVPLQDYTVDQKNNRLKITFMLPPGSYATVILRELLKEKFWIGILESVD